MPYRQAALWWRDAGAAEGEHGRLEGLSGVAEPARKGTFPAWLEGRLADFADAHPFKAQNSTGDQNAQNGLNAAGAPAGAPPGLPMPCYQSPQDEAMRREYLPSFGLWIELPLGELWCAAAFWRDAPWKKAEAALLSQLGIAYADAWRAQPFGRHDWSGTKTVRSAAGRVRRWSRSRVVRAVLLAAVVGAAALPIRQSVLAPAEIASQNAFVVRAPLQGVVDEIVVKPNAAVKKGDLLVKMEARELRGSLQAAEQSLAVAQAELRQAQQQAFADERSKMMLGVLVRRRDQAKSEAAYLAGELARTEIRAKRDGIAVFSDPQSWTGRPVSLGERILEIADPGALCIRADIPAGDAISLEAGAEVRFFLNAYPLDPMTGRLRQVAYRAVPAADGTLAYRAEIDFDRTASEANGRPDAESEVARIGLKGTAKIYGERTPLILYLLRKPLASLRLFLGF